MSEAQDYKAKQILQDTGKSSFQKYRDITYGATSLTYVVWSELVVTLVSWIPGALGLALRSLFYPSLFGACGRGCVFGRNITLRHAKKIRLGDRAVLDDNTVVDAKGESNAGITIGSGVYIGRNTIVYCKNGDITLEDAVNISSNCQIFSSNKIVIGRDTVIGAFTYILSGGEYDVMDKTPFSQQSGMNTKGPLTIGPNCWLGANVTVTDGSSIGEHCVLGAGAVVTKPIPAHQVAVGIPARPVRSIEATT